MEFGLRGKRALVLGSSSGIGRAVAEALVKEGARVAVASRSIERITRAKNDIGAEVALAVDLTKPGAGSRVVQEAARELGGLDILVTNTGGPPAGPFPEITDEMWHTGFQALWLSAVDSIREALPGMRQRKWGRIVLITSTAAREPIPGLTVSNGLRAGLLGLTKSIAQEVAADGVTINAILPGYTDTERLHELGRSIEQLSATVPARRIGKPSEIGAVAAFLSSEPSSYLTGQAIAVDGGSTRSF